MEFRLFDSHCHLQLPGYDLDRPDVLGRMKEQGMGAIVVGINFQTSESAVGLAEAHDNLWATIAVHPGHTHNPHHDEFEAVSQPSAEFFDDEKFSALAMSKKVVGVGETGLDYYRLEVPAGELEKVKNLQRENFVAHIRFAKKRGLPMSLHIRDSSDLETAGAYADALEILRAEKFGTGVMHCFSGTVTEAEKFLELGFHISFTGAISYPPKKDQSENALHPVARIIPADRLLIETDAPWLTPAPLRGERNEPAHVRITAEHLAKIRKTSFEEIAETTAKNTVRLFNLAVGLNS